MRSSILRFLPALLCALALPTSSAFGATILWDLVGVQFTDGTHAIGSFDYDADTNAISNINIVTGLATYTTLDPTLSNGPFEFVFVPNVPLTFGAKVPALVLALTPGLTDAGGSVQLSGANGFSAEALTCNDDCASASTLHQVDEGQLTAAAIPEPSSALLLATGGLLFFLLPRTAPPQEPKQRPLCAPAKR